MSHRVVWISYSRLFFVRWLNSPGVSYQGGTALWSWRSSFFQKAEVVGRCCTWSWTCLAALHNFDVVCVQKWTRLSHDAPVQLLSRILGLSSARWRIGSRRNIRLCCLSLQSSSLPPTLGALSMHVRRANYQAAIWRRALHLGALFLAHMAMASSASLNVEMILQVISPLKSNGWLVLLPHRLCWTWSRAVAHRVTPHSIVLVDAAKDILTEMKFVSAQTARISHTSKHHSLHMMTKRLMVTHDLILLALCWTSSTRVLERVSSSFLYARSLHVLQHSTIYLSIFT